MGKTREILLKEGTVQEKKDYFLKRTINHPILHNVFLGLMEKVKESKEGRVYLVFGPTGVGKSTLCKRVYNEFISQNELVLKKDKGMIPVVSLELPFPDNGKFNWKDFYRRLLKKLNEPLIDYKISSEKNNNANKRISSHHPGTTPELRESLENAIEFRKTKIILLDEGQHLLKTVSGQKTQDQMDAIKSIANITGAVFVLFGTYDLMDFIDLNGQLGRRSNEIHFRRYQLKNKQDTKDFKSILLTFQNHLPLKKETDLIKHWEFLYERTVGCVGILKEWLDLCLVEALNKGLSNITYALLKKNAPHPSKALKIADEAVDGEDKIEEREDDRRKLLRKLGFENDNEEEMDEITQEENSNKNNIGIRTPYRDEIGIAESGI